MDNEIHGDGWIVDTGRSTITLTTGDREAEFSIASSTSLEIVDWYGVEE